MLGFHLQIFSFHNNFHFNGVHCNGTEDQFRIFNVLQTLLLFFLKQPKVLL